MEFLRELWNLDTSVQNLKKHIHFESNAAETRILSRKLEQSGINPTLTKLQNYLLRCLTIPVDELPQPERNIILRSGRPERVGG